MRVPPERFYVTPSIVPLQRPMLVLSTMVHISDSSDVVQIFLYANRPACANPKAPSPCSPEEGAAEPKVEPVGLEVGASTLARDGAAEGEAVGAAVEDDDGDAVGTDVGEELKRASSTGSAATGRGSAATKPAPTAESGASPRMQGASPVTSQYLSESFTPEPQQEDLPPGLLEHSEPPHAPQLVGQQTELPRLMPGMLPSHVSTDSSVN